MSNRSFRQLFRVTLLLCAELWITWWVSKQMHRKHMLHTLLELPFQGSKTGHHCHYKYTAARSSREWQRAISSYRKDLYHKYTSNSIIVYTDFALIASAKTSTLATTPSREKGCIYPKKELIRPAPSPRESHLLVTSKQLMEHWRARPRGQFKMQHKIKCPVCNSAPGALTTYEDQQVCSTVTHYQFCCKIKTGKTSTSPSFQSQPQKFWSSVRALIGQDAGFSSLVPATETTRIRGVASKQYRERKRNFSAGFYYREGTLLYLKLTLLN